MLATGLLFALTVAPASAADVAKGQKVFRLCMACHRIGPGAGTLVGPELNGVVGRKAGSLQDYPFSEAMKNSGLTWDEATLTKYLHGPRAVVPGTRMTFAGLSKDERSRASPKMRMSPTSSPTSKPSMPPATR